MKRLFSAILVSLLLFNFAGLFIYFSVQLFRIHVEMKAKLKNLPDEKLEVFTLHLEDFNKAKVEEDELQVNDKMYDIARVKLSGDSVIVYTLHDAAEDNLLAFLDEVVKRPLREKQSTPAQILQFISLTFLPPGEHELSALQALTIAPSTNYVLIDFFCSRSIESPPPRS